jgi:hypothetical protein
VSKAAFSFSELLTLLDVDDVPRLAAPFPAELEGCSKNVSFTMSAPHLLPPRSGSLSVSSIVARLSIGDFRAGGSATWQHAHDYIVGYLDDTLRKVPRGEGLPWYRTYKGHGVTVGFTYVPQDERSIDVVVTRDEPFARTLLRAFGVERLPSELDRNWSDVVTTREMHVEAAAVGEEVWLRTNARYVGTQSDASRCAWAVRFWLNLWETYDEGAMSLRAVEGRTLAEAERATRHPMRKESVVTIEMGGERRRDQFEIHMPRRWLVEAGERHE